MQSSSQLNAAWSRAVRLHATTPLVNAEGKSYRAIGDRSLVLLDALWKAPRGPLPDLGARIAAGEDIRFWSDQHFGHDAIRWMCARTEFPDVGAMDAVLWENWRDAVAEADLVVCLGDLALKNPIAVQRQAVAEFGDRHITLVGNHDTKGAKTTQWAASGALATLAFCLPLDLVHGWMDEDFGELADLVEWKRLPRHVNFGLSHWPVPPPRMPGPGWLNLHGHIHNRPTGGLRMNCSVEAVGYRPQGLRSLLTPELLDGLVRRQAGLDGDWEAVERSAGDAAFMEP